ncbi:type II secretion system protein GspD [Rhodoferax koreense]|uniref:Type II secretion system protein GspD n=1 Tax=Rhodoferax koreensis TaxID=1842727 RepID=A0A1P8JSS9_9BURK|nr:type II secretion system secretin GspD [Rhodoferax koreense]APW36807.1 type II secretion system protein GspD [Rhodoferax koreense]
MTKPIFRARSFAITSIALCAMIACATGTFSSNSWAQAAAGQREPITLNFVNAEIEAVARTMATLTGRNVVVDPRVKGTMTLSTERPVAPSVAYDQFLATLRVQGFTVVQSGGLDKIVPEADAKLQGGAETVSSTGDTPRGAAGNQIVTQIFKLNYENAANLVPVLRPLISPNNTINVNPGNNSLVITDYADNLRRIARIVASMDVSNATDLEIIPLQYAVATDLVPLLTRLIDPGSSGGAGGVPVAGQSDTSFRTTVLAEPRSNALIVRAANPARLNLVRGLVARLDQPAAVTPGGANNPGGNIHVVYLKNADATKLAITLRAAMSGEARGGSGSTGSTGGGLSLNTAALSTSGSASGGASGTSSGATGSLNSANSNQPSTGGQIQADPSTNSLIITAPEPQYRQLRAVIDQLDGRRAQVLVESLIVEVNASKAAQFGIQWQGLLGSGNNVGILGTNFSTGGTANIINLALTAAGATSSSSSTSSTLPSTGGNFGIAHKTGGVYVLGFLANFLQTNGDGNVLSTPNLLTLDNEEAKIVIGENVPFVTGSYTSNNSSSGSVNPFTTVERKDVGLTLKIRPQINENGTVKLVIFQETSSVKSGTELATNGPTTTKRSIESTVLVDDGSVVVIGGLLQDQYAGNQDKVPIVGDVPFFGNLFKSEVRSRTKTNLMVFLRPVVVRDARETDALSMDRYDLIRGMQRDTQPEQSKMIPVNEAPILAPIVNPNLPARSGNSKDVPQPPLGQSSDSVAPGTPLQTLPTR